MDRMTLEAKKREKYGSGESGRIRRSGMIPAIVYGHGMKPVSIQVDNGQFLHAIHTKAGENVLIDLKVEGVKLKESTCLIKDIQHHPVSDRVEHVDFTVISLTEKIEVKVPLHTVNAEECVGLKEEGVLEVVHHEIEVECLPTNIPQRIDVDIKAMKIGDSIHAKDLVIPEGVTVKLDPEEVVVAVHQPRKEEVPAAEGEMAAEPEVIEKGKKVAEGEEGAEGEAKPKAAASAKTDKPAEKAEKKPEKK